MKARNVMTLNAVTVQPATPIMHAIRLMLQKRISGLPVVDEAGQLVGIVTEGDFLRRVETGTQQQRPRWVEFLLGPGRLAEEYVRTHARKVGEIMSPDVVTVTEDTPLDEIVKTMERRQIKRVPVVRGKQLVGIVSRANLLHALASLGRDIRLSEVSDATIREKLMAELHKQNWAPVGALDITVRNGVVDLWGTITDERERQALIVAAENVAGVKAVHDHLAWVDTTSGSVIPAAYEAGVETRQPQQR
jgi:CBS domain-containing protein